MILPGLVSITFRALPVPAIVDLARSAGLAGIEWGGDVHVPHGNLAAARDAATCTARAGLRVAAYGSYYRVGSSEERGMTFASVLESAVALGAPLIRVWAGDRGSTGAAVTHWQHVIDDSRRIGDLAAARGLRIVFEFHGATLTDTHPSALRLLQSVNHPAVFTYWQPPAGIPREEAQAGLRALLPWVRGLHVYHWSPTHEERHPLAEGADGWSRVLHDAREAGHDMYALLEYVRDDDPRQLAPDAATLRRWLAGGG
ncbi:MAG: sugar phosphate isomerase/epimerase [Lentisphaerae bacterium]|nr:sugar phosphate isomerase/epimerase [Lentisphaerota bacterium]